MLKSKTQVSNIALCFVNYAELETIIMAIHTSALLRLLNIGNCFYRLCLLVFLNLRINKLHMLCVYLQVKFIARR